jgi:hypothetical protein
MTTRRSSLFAFAMKYPPGAVIVNKITIAREYSTLRAIRHRAICLSVSVGIRRS